MNEEERDKATKNIETAVAMYHSSQMLHEALGKGIDGTKEEQDRAKGFFLAGNILWAFGIENALKALIRREGKTPKNIHNLRKLYDKLKPETQQRISEKGAAISIRVNGEVRGIRVEGVIDEHQESFKEWRYREVRKALPAFLSVLPGTLQAIIQTHSEKYEADIKREKKQGTGQFSQAMHERAMNYIENVLMPKSG